MATLSSLSSRAPCSNNGGCPSMGRDDIIALLPHLQAFARSIAGPNRADDLVQDTVVLALDHWHQFTPGTNLKAWLFRILRNRFLSIVSRKAETSEVSCEQFAELATIDAPQESQLEALAFKRACAQLRLEHREVLVLGVVHGLPYEQVAQICGCEVGTVKSRIWRARISLKRMMLGDEPALPSHQKKRRGLLEEKPRQSGVWY